MRNVKSRPRSDHEAPSEESALMPSGYAASFPECHHVYPNEGGAALRRTTQYDCPPVRSTHGPKSTSTHPAVEPASADPWVRLLAEGNPPTVTRRETPSTSLVPRPRRTRRLEWPGRSMGRGRTRRATSPNRRRRFRR